MIALPDGNTLDMRWKSVSYIVNQNRVVFPIEPMAKGADIVFVPLPENCNGVMDSKLRNEFIFLLKITSWKRKINIVELNIQPQVISVTQSLEAIGSMEATEAGKQLESAYLFDPVSPLHKEQVKELYIMLETRFARNVSGTVEIVKDGILPGSVMDKIVLPILQTNSNVSIAYV
jgi:hypothetical protein